MATLRWARTVLVLAACLGAAGVWTGPGAAVAKDAATQPATRPATRPVEPKPLSDNVKKGIEWLVRSQLENGAWGQGDESAHMRGASAPNAAPAAADGGNVADTCAAVLALMRAGSTATEGPHAGQIRKAADYLCTQVDRADSTSLFVTDARGTRLQGKLGTYIDTFLAALVLAELKDRMPDAVAQARPGGAG